MNHYGGDIWSNNRIFQHKATISYHVTKCTFAKKKEGKRKVKIVRNEKNLWYFKAIDKKRRRTLLRITIQMRPPNGDLPIEQVFR